ncbi:MAG: hypothetical protein ABIJ97_16530 [Bacteroidota bacterium]
MYRMIFSLLLIAIAVCCNAEIKDPYLILQKMEDITNPTIEDNNLQYKIEKAKLTSIEYQMKCDLIAWHSFPIKYRECYYFAEDTIIRGRNDSISWECSNGAIKIISDSISAKKRLLDSLIYEREYLDKYSKYFSIIYDELVDLKNNTCFRIIVNNSINNSITKYYVDTLTYILVKTENETPVGNQSFYYSDYREVEGSLRIFQIEEYVSGNLSTTIKYDFIKYLDGLPDSLFDPPISVAGESPGVGE